MQTSYLPKDFIQTIIDREIAKKSDSDEKEDDSDDFTKPEGNLYTQSEFVCYQDMQKKVEGWPVVIEDDITIRQVSTKLLNFDWIFVGDADQNNAAYFIKMLSKVEH